MLDTLNFFFFFLAHASESFPKNDFEHVVYSKPLKLSCFHECGAGKGLFHLWLCHPANAAVPWTLRDGWVSLPLPPRLSLLIGSFFGSVYVWDFGGIENKLGLSLWVLRGQCSYLPNAVTSA